MEKPNSIKNSQENKLSYQSKYEIPSQKYIIGSGQFGQVKHAIVKKTKETICVKILKKGNSSGTYFNSVVSEKDINNCLHMINQKHQNLVQIFDVYNEQQEDCSYIFMELCQGNLQQFQENENQFFSQFNEISELIRQIVSGYLELRKRNIIHRDIKEDNILYLKTNQNKIVYKISDYGLSKLVDGQNIQYFTKKVGSPYYMAPEVFNNEEYNDKCDVYSFATIIKNLVFGQTQERVKFDKNVNQKFSEIMKKQIQEKKVDPRIIYLLDHMIVDDPLQRFDWSDLSILFQYDLKSVSNHHSIPLATNLKTQQDVYMLILFNKLLSENQKEQLKNKSKINGQGRIETFQYIQPDTSSFSFIILDLEYSKNIIEQMFQQCNQLNGDHESLKYVDKLLGESQITNQIKQCQKFQHPIYKQQSFNFTRLQTNQANHSFDSAQFQQTPNKCQSGQGQTNNNNCLYFPNKTSPVPNLQSSQFTQTTTLQAPILQYKAQIQITDQSILKQNNNTEQQKNFQTRPQKNISFIQQQPGSQFGNPSFNSKQIDLQKKESQPQSFINSEVQRFQTMRFQQQQIDAQIPTYQLTQNVFQTKPKFIQQNTNLNPNNNQK